MSVRPRRATHRGVVAASGLLIDEHALVRAEARRRVLATWAPGTIVALVEGALVVRWPTPRMTDCRRAFGTPLVAGPHTHGPVLLAAPLDLDELLALQAPAGAIVRVCAGEARAELPSSEDDLASWLDLSSMELLEVSSLGAPPSQPEVVLPPPVVVTRDSFGAGPVAKGQPELERALAARAKASGGRSSTAPGGLLRSWLEAPMRALSRLFGRRSTSTAATRRASPLFIALALAFDRLRDFFMRALVASRIARLIGRRQARYFARMMELFESGDLGEALRHAIPLSAGLEDKLRPALALPSPRARLELSLAKRQPASSTFLLDGDLFGELRRRYRAAFTRLERAGDIERAAFVLAELLAASEEAVAFLERHGRLRLAAELAESRELAPGLVVRQWFLAGDRERALRIAYDRGAFADAVTRLARSHTDEAKLLRLAWAERLEEHRSC